MAAGFEVGCVWYKVGSGGFLYSFFSTVCYHLENKQWGSVYPYIMKRLYYGELEWQNVKYARRELEEIQSRLAEFPPSDIVWSFEDLSQRPPWGDNISEDITNLANYFVTSGGNDLITVMFEVFNEAEEYRKNIKIISL